MPLSQNFVTFHLPQHSKIGKGMFNITFLSMFAHVIVLANSILIKECSSFRMLKRIHMLGYFSSHPCELKMQVLQTYIWELRKCITYELYLQLKMLLYRISASCKYSSGHCCEIVKQNCTVGRHHVIGSQSQWCTIIKDSECSVHSIIKNSVSPASVVLYQMVVKVNGGGGDLV